MSDEPVATPLPVGAWWEKFPWAQFIFTLILLSMISYALHAILTRMVPTENQRIADTMLGYLLGILSSGMSFWFNTTRGSQTKDELLANSVPVGSIEPKP